MNASSPPPESEAPALVERLWAGLWRRVRRAWLCLRFRRVRWGRGADVRAGLRLRLGKRGQMLVGEQVVVDFNATIECMGTLSIGARTIFGHHLTLAAKGNIEIGPDCLIAEMVSIRDHDHRFDDFSVPIRDQGAVCAPVRLGRNVWLASKVTVLKGVTIGDNAIIGAGAVVTKNIPAGAVAVGVPARVVRMRNGAPVPQEHE